MQTDNDNASKTVIKINEIDMIYKWILATMEIPYNFK